MSIAEIERFAADLKSNEALRGEAAKDQTSMVAFAASKGYAFTADDVKEYAKVTAKTAGRELADAELGGIVGGAIPDYGEQPMREMMTMMMGLLRPGSPRRDIPGPEAALSQNDIGAQANVNYSSGIAGALVGSAVSIVSSKRDK